MPILGAKGARDGDVRASVVRSPASRLEAEAANTMDVYRPERAAGMVYGRAVHGTATAALREDRAQCGNPRCSRGWMRFWKDRRRPIFERRWGCSGECVETMVAAAVGRELGEGRVVEEDGQDGHDRRHRHRIPLGLILLAQGWITHPQLQHALEAQRRAGTGRIGRWLIDECGLKEDRVTHALGVQWGCPVLPIAGFDPGAMALVVPKVLIESLGMVPLRIAAGRILYLAFEDQLDASAAFAIERMSGLRVENGLVDGAQLKDVRQRLCECEFVDATLEQVADIESMSRKVALTLGVMQPRASRLVRVHQFYWLRMWLESGAMRSGDGGIPATKEDVVDRIYTVGLEH